MNLVIHHHLGIGDSFMCNGLVRHYAKMNYQNVFVISKNKCKDMISYMYRDDPKISVIPIQDNGNEHGAVNTILKSPSFKGSKFIKSGFESIDICCQRYIDANMSSQFSFDIAFYEECGLYYSDRWDKWKFDRDYEAEEVVYNKLNPNNEEYIFVHDDPSRGMIIPSIGSKYKEIRNDVTINPLNIIRILENAKEIHAMESSIKCLIDQYSTVKCPKYLYTNIRPDGHGKTLRSGSIHDWIII